LVVIYDDFRLLLWDCDDRRYSYYIEVSNNKSDWEMIWDRSKEYCQSWQHISFPRRPVVFIRIVGTHNTANEVFHCVHFECPASPAMQPGLQGLNTSSLQRNLNEEISAEQLSTNNEADDSASNNDIEAAAAALPNFNEAADLKNYEEMSQVSQHSSPTSNSGGHFALPMGASACSMAKSGQNLQQYPATVTSATSNRSSPVLYEATASGAASNSRQSFIQFYNSAQSLPASLGQSPSRTASVDEAASAALAHLLDIDDSASSAGGQTGSRSNSRKVYQHAFSVRVPPNSSSENNNNPASNSSTNSSSKNGAIPRNRNNKRPQQPPNNEDEN
jgi:hypothetical protein